MQGASRSSCYPESRLGVSEPKHRAPTAVPYYHSDPATPMPLPAIARIVFMATTDTVVTLLLSR